MTKAQNQTASVAFAMRRARITTLIPRSHLARLMDISITQLNKYETGREEIPPAILESIFTLGYMMMHVRYLNRYYVEISRLNKKMTAYRQCKAKQ